MTADLDDLPFDIVRRGYDRGQVEDRIGRLLAERDTLRADRQNAAAERERLARELDSSSGDTRTARVELAEARAEVERLAAQVAELSTVPTTVDGMSNRLQQMVRVAQDEVNDMRTRATRSAAQVLSMAQAEADELRESSEQERRTFEAEQRAAREELDARLEESRARLQELREEADSRRAGLDAELAERRAKDEQALAAEVAERREAMLAELAAQEKRQRDEAQRIVDAATARARALVDEATAETDRTRSHTREQVVRANEELDQLRALQHQIAEQLSGVRSLLDWTLPRITPTVAATTGEAAVPGPSSALTAGSGTADDEVPRTLSAPPAPPVAMRPEAPVSADRERHPLDESPAFVVGLSTPVFDATVLGTAGRAADDGSEGASAAGDAPADAGPRAGDPVDAAAGPARSDSPADSSGSGFLGSRSGRIPRTRGADEGDVRPSPVARSGSRAGARR